MRHLHADHYFCIGSSHQRTGLPCQDYAVSGTLPDGRVYGVVCDGCSGADARTDIGARVLALALEQALQQTRSLEACFDASFVAALTQRMMAMPLGGTAADYLASVVAFCADGVQARVFMVGDGAVATRALDGSLHLTEVRWPDNAPFYLGYHLQPALLARFTQSATQAGACVSLRSHASAAVSSTRWVSAQDFLSGWQTELDLTHIQALAVLSDGVAQVRGLDTLAAATELLAFKNFAGSFVKRRALSALTRWGKCALVPEDDLGIAALVLCQEEAS